MSNGVYRRSRRKGGRVTSTYEGSGLVGRVARLAHELERAKRAESERRRRSECGRLTALAGSLAGAVADTKTMADAAMRCAGYHQHKRQWRLKRGG